MLSDMQISSFFEVRDTWSKGADGLGCLREPRKSTKSLKEEPPDVIQCGALWQTDEPRWAVPGGESCCLGEGGAGGHGPGHSGAAAPATAARVPQHLHLA